MEPIIQTNINTKSDETGLNSVCFHCCYCNEDIEIIGEGASKIIDDSSIVTGFSITNCPKCNHQLTLDVL